MTCQKNEKEFSERLIEICGSSEAGEVKRKLGISYQAARNYLDGRLPDSNILLLIAEKTPYSIHWLLTGKGEKMVGGETVSTQNTLLPADQTRRLVREELAKILSGGLSGQISSDEQSDNDKTSSNEAVQPRIVKLSASQIKREKKIEKNAVQSKSKINGNEK